MFTLSAFADEISPDPREQIDVLKACGVRHIEFRSIHKTNVLALTDEQIARVQEAARRRGLQALSASARRSARSRSTQPFEPHLDKLKRAIELCGVFGTPNIRVFSYYPPGNDPNFDPTNWPAHRDEVMRRMREKAELAAEGRRRAVPRERAPHLRRLAGPRRATCSTTREQPGAARGLRRRRTTSSAASTRSRAGRRRRSSPRTSTSRTGRRAGTRPGTSTA